MAIILHALLPESILHQFNTDGNAIQLRSGGLLTTGSVFPCMLARNDPQMAEVLADFIHNFCFFSSMSLL